MEDPWNQTLDRRRELEIKHLDDCWCRLTHDDHMTSEGIRNLVTYEIDYYCHMSGVTAGAGTMWKIVEGDDENHDKISELNAPAEAFYFTGQS